MRPAPSVAPRLSHAKPLLCPSQTATGAKHPSSLVVPRSSPSPRDSILQPKGASSERSARASRTCELVLLLLLLLLLLLVVEELLVQPDLLGNVDPSPIRIGPV